jgi:hypothetical protein
LTGPAGHLRQLVGSEENERGGADYEHVSR